jgi:trans-aconitate methyltransferase
MPIWDAELYLRFNEERTRPCRDLAARVAIAAPNRVIFPFRRLFLIAYQRP